MQHPEYDPTSDICILDQEEDGKLTEFVIRVSCMSLDLSQDEIPYKEALQNKLSQSHQMLETIREVEGGQECGCSPRGSLRPIEEENMYDEHRRDHQSEMTGSLNKSDALRDSIRIESTNSPII